MPVIDAHVHVLPNFPPMAPWEDLGRVDRLLHHMDECEVDKAGWLAKLKGTYRAEYRRRAL